MWETIAAQAGSPFGALSAAELYDDDRFKELLTLTSSVLNMEPQAVLESFGENAGRDLLHLYQAHIRDEWKTLEVLLNTETLIHHTVRKHHAGASPPVIETTKLTDSTVQVIYSSKRRLCDLIPGMIRGIASFYGDEVQVKQQSCMLHGDPFCCFRVKVRPPDRVLAKQESAKKPISSLTRVSIKAKSGKSSDHAIDRILINEDVNFIAPSATPGSIGKVNHFEVTKVIGGGRMSLVFECLDIRLGRRVAIKFLRPSIANASLRASFFREARAIASIGSPYVVNVYDIGVAGDQFLPYIVMELLQGESLGDFVDQRQRLSAQEIVKIGIDVCHGLAAVHAAGFTHCDIKPLNVWMDQSTGKCKLLDFGFAAKQASSTFADLLSTSFGTPAFVSPEQASGLGVDCRSDIYSLGVMLYYLLTGNNPFQRASTLATLNAIQYLDPAVVDECFCHCEGLWGLVLKLIEKSPDNRPQKIEEVLKSLTGLADPD